MRSRVIRFQEMAGCPALRLDPEHYIPKHRAWECLKGGRLRSRGAMVRAWLDGEITSEEMLEAMEAA